MGCGLLYTTRSLILKGELIPKLGSRSILSQGHLNDLISIEKKSPSSFMATKNLNCSLEFPSKALIMLKERWKLP
jgi:hypothetical protein